MFGFMYKSLLLYINTFFSNFRVNELADCYCRGVPGCTVAKNLLATVGEARDMGSISGSGRSLGVGNSNPFQYTFLGNSMDRGAWWATDHGVTKSWIQLIDWVYTHRQTIVESATLMLQTFNLHYIN